jgi:flagellar hook-basal body complex protein FliE
MIGMMSPITAPSLALPASLPAISGEGAEFSQVLNRAIDRVEAARAGANTRIQSFLSGENVDLHEVAIATQQAELSLELFQQVRNKVVQAYQEVMRMQL